jgi:hypothetical protein
MDFTKRNFPLGWIPSDNAINGREDGLLRMDNCELDDLGIVRGMKFPGSVSAAAFASDVTSLYSKVLNLNAKDATYPVNAKVRYVYTNNGTLKRNYGTASKALTTFEDVFTGATVPKCTFLNALGHVFCLAGSKKYKDDGILAAVVLGFSSGGAPTTASGGAGVLTGDYYYIQVDVNNTGYYDEKGIKSAASTVLTVVDEQITVTTAARNAQANEIWVFRASALSTEYRLIKILDSGTGYGAFTDNLSDEQAEINFSAAAGYKLTYYQEAIPNDVIGAIWFGDRVVYCTTDSVIPSLYLDPGSFDGRFRYQLGSTFGDVCYFITKVSEGEFLVGTNNDIYSFTGDFSGISLPDGTETLNVTIRPLGIKKPPVSDAHYNDNGALYYLAEDGWRILNGNGTKNIIGNLDLLYRRETRHDFPPVSLNSLQSNIAYISCTKSKGRFFASMEHDTLDRVVHIYNEKLDYWTVFHSALNTSPLTLFTEEDGTVISGDKSGAFNYLKEWGNFAGGPMPITVRTTFNGFQDKLRRKDIEDFRVCVDTGGLDFTFKVLYLNPTTGVSASVTQTINTSEYVEVPLSDANLATIQLKKIYQLELTSVVGSSDFQFFGYKVSYTMRPEQRSFFLLPQTNGGDPRRKRINTWPIIIDTLGNNVVFTPRFDGTNKTTSTLSSSEPRTLFHYFTDDQTTVDFGGKLVGGPFELYEFMKPNITEYFPISAKFFKQSETNYGTGSRKRTATWPLVLNSFGADATVTPSVDGTNSTALVVNTALPENTNYYYTVDTVGVDFGYEVSSGTAFELYPNEGPKFLEALPLPAKFIRFDDNDFGKPVRKDVNTIPFRINTLSEDVTIVPRIDAVDQPPSTINNEEAGIVNHYYTSITSGVCHGFSLSGTEPFEWYGPVTPNFTFEYPQKAQVLHIPDTNLGSPTKKRVRTWPFKINTYGAPVIFTPNVDGVVQDNASSWSSPAIDFSTEYHLFEDDVFGVDYGGTLVSGTPFEFSDVQQPAVVENLPQPKLFDQLGPIEIYKTGVIKAFKFRCIPTAPTIRYRIFDQDLEVTAGTVNVTPNQHKYYDIVVHIEYSDVKILRVELESDLVFYRTGAWFKIQQVGKESQYSYVEVGA